MSTQCEEKRYDPNDRTLKFVNRPDDLDPHSSDQSLRAEMSCGHAVTPESLTGWCRSLLDQSQHTFRCPALKEGTPKKCDAVCTSKKCGAVWSYQEVRRLALLTPEEIQYFEENIARLAAAQYCEFKTCPGCKTCVERKNLSNLAVQCTLCTEDKGKRYLFCWQCLKTWKGAAPGSNCCNNDGCINYDLELLKKCGTTALPEVEGVDACPSIRACPTCGMRVEHNNTGCKNIICPRCHVEFCFVCLKITPECLKTSSYFIACSDGVAPRQTSIPVWRRN
ncbi:uncharacterized protein ACO6RY_03299 [Pungitius sinensis]